MANVKHRIECAQGKRECDLILLRATYLDVFSCEWRQGDIALADGVVVGIGENLSSGLKAKRTLDTRGKWLVPGFVDAHVHIESSLLIPPSFQNAVLPRGTTSAVCDPHELANVQGLSAPRSSTWIFGSC
jgi:adenine deaminase